MALRDCSLSEDLVLPQELEKGVWILDQPPIKLDEFWRKQLGEFESDNFLKSNFFIFFFMESDSLKERNQENLFLDRMILFMFDALMLNGIPSIGGDIKFSGYYEQGHQVIWNISKNNPTPCHLRQHSIKNESLNGLYRIAKNLNDIKSDPEENNYFRIKRGYDSLIRGMGEKFPDQRLHKFVRSIEAFLNPREGRGTRDFVHRGGLLIGINKRKMLREMYELRSVAEHMNHYENILKNDYSDNEGEKIALLRCYQAEKFACQLYIRLANQENLKDWVKDNNKPDEFWGKRDDEISEIWGELIKLPENYE